MTNLTENPEQGAKVLKMGADFYWKRPFSERPVGQIRERIRKKSKWFK